jgi:rhodanese-related sulfurtransferase
MHIANRKFTLCQTLKISILTQFSGPRQTYMTHMMHTNLLIPFVQNNWIWIVLLLALIAYYLWFEIQNLRYQKYMIPPPSLVQLINKESAQILDLRPKKFFDDAHIENAINLECRILLKEQPKINFEKDKPIILFSGFESDGRKVLNIIKNQGFKRIYILSGGASEWKRLNYPFTSSSSSKNPSKKSSSKKSSLSKESKDSSNQLDSKLDLKTEDNKPEKIKKINGQKSSAKTVKNLKKTKTQDAKNA